MSYILDLCFVAVLVLSVVLAAKKGFFATLLDLAAYVLSLIGAKLFSAQFAPAAYEALVQPALRSRIVQGLGAAADADFGTQITSALKSLPNAISGMMQMLGISRESLIQKVESLDLTGKHAVDRLMRAAVDPLATAIVRTALFVLIGLVLSVILKFVFHLLNRVIKDVPAIKQINTGLGVVLGLLRGAVVVFLLALAIGLISGLVANERLIEIVRHSYVEKWVSGFMDSISGYVVVH